MSDRFLTKNEIAALIGRKTKSKQIEVLRRMGLPSRVNANLVPPALEQRLKEGKK